MPQRRSSDRSAAPIAILIWLYLISIAVLIGAALNAAFDHNWRVTPQVG